MNMTRVREVVSDILSERLSSRGYSGADVAFEEDFDGEEIIRVTVHLARPLDNFDDFYDSVGAIRDRLMKEGDDRFVFLNQDYPGANEIAEEDDGPSRGVH